MERRGEERRRKVNREERKVRKGEESGLQNKKLIKMQ